MAVYAALHAATRIVRRVTTNSEHVVAADEALESVVGAVNLAGGPWVLEVGGTVRSATPQEIDEADADPMVVNGRRAAILAAYLSACDDLATDGSVPAKYRTFFTLHAKVMRGLTR